MSNISPLLCFIFVSFAAFLVADAHDQPQIYELKKGTFSAKFTNWGATIMSVVLPDKHGKLDDIVLGYDTADEYKNDKPYLGALVGRVANRIAGAKFTLNGTEYKLVANEKNNMLHGGKKGFSDVLWKMEKIEPGETPSITFSYISPDGDEGFPGELNVTVKYTLAGKSKLSVKMRARPMNKSTPVNLAQHSYWNLGGHNSGTILADEIQIHASHITPTNSELIPTGEITPVKGTPYDFLQMQQIGSKIKALPNLYDINYVLDREPGTLRPVATVCNKKSGRTMILHSDAPGVQFYTGNYLKDLKGKGGAVYQAHSGLALETQGFPDAVNHPKFPSQIVNKGETYRHKMLYEFVIEKEKKEEEKEEKKEEKHEAQEERGKIEEEDEEKEAEKKEEDKKEKKEEKNEVMEEKGKIAEEDEEKRAERKTEEKTPEKKAKEEEKKKKKAEKEAKEKKEEEEKKKKKAEKEAKEKKEDEEKKKKKAEKEAKEKKEDEEKKKKKAEKEAKEAKEDEEEKKKKAEKDAKEAEKDAKEAEEKKKKKAEKEEEKKKKMAAKEEEKKKKMAAKEEEKKKKEEEKRKKVAKVEKEEKKEEKNEAKEEKGKVEEEKAEKAGKMNR